ncbi:MAG TPA: POTRA domain-containing protein [Terracidiphilus sp.]|nr:POTRA domain-containing protein [Terracidiphilus sp.]
MRRIRGLSLLLGLSLPAATPVCAQQFQPAAIHFTGAPDYSDSELMAATRLKPGETLSQAEMNQRSQMLMDSGLFDGVNYKFNGHELTVSLTPAAQLYEVRLENLPLPAGADVDAKIRARCALYHGKVPSQGTALDDARSALEDLLKAQGITAKIEVTPLTDRVLREVTAMSFTITSPPVLIGAIEGDAGLDPDAAKLLGTLTGGAYDRQESASAIARDAEQVYRDKGYLEAEVQVAQATEIAAGPDAVRVPFKVSPQPGPLYKVEAIHLAPDMIVTQADFDKQSLTHPGDVANAVHIRENWHFIERQYHNRGYMKAQVTPTPTLNHAQATVSYAVSAVPGPVYTMGKLTVENVSDDLRSAIVAAWKMPPGAVFNEGAILGFFATHSVNPQLERVFAAVNVKYTLRLNDDSRTVDTTIRLEKKS